MHITSITLNNFRCFENKTFDIDGQFVVVKGKNGSGKTSLLEAIHYSCYLRSFRTHLNRDLVNLAEKHFFVRINFQDTQQPGADQIQIGYSEKDGKLVKFNQKPVVSYKDLVSNYRIFTLTADDLQLVSGAPEKRREFLNYSLFLQDPSFLDSIKLYKQVVQQRNVLLCRLQQPTDELAVWTKKLWEISREIQQKRIEHLEILEGLVNEFLVKQESMTVAFKYSARNKSNTKKFEEFEQRYQQFAQTEFKFGRSLFGAHLDDFSIIFQDKKARMFASRGQQKLLVFLIKLAQLQQTLNQGNPGVLLLDDFLTDFDPEKVQFCLSMLKTLSCQIFISCPTDSHDFLKPMLKEKIFLIEL